MRFGDYQIEVIPSEPFGLDGGNQVFVATDEPHGQIECRVGRG